MRAWTALRVVAGAGGARRAAGLEAPFVGRERELPAIIEAGEWSAPQGHARRVAVVGEAGAGKSRLVWEFFKYLDGIRGGPLVASGPVSVLRRGGGVLGAGRDGPHARRDRRGGGAGAAREKLRADGRGVRDRRARAQAGRAAAGAPAAAGGADRDADRADLFSGWRLFFERMAADEPVVLVFEDLQWADGGLLDFIDYLLEWSAELPIFILALGRPELRRRGPRGP